MYFQTVSYRSGSMHGRSIVFFVNLTDDILQLWSCLILLLLLPSVKWNTNDSGSDIVLDSPSSFPFSQIFLSVIWRKSQWSWSHRWWYEYDAKIYWSGVEAEKEIEMRRRRRVQIRYFLIYQERIFIKIEFEQTTPDPDILLQICVLLLFHLTIEIEAGLTQCHVIFSIIYFSVIGIHLPHPNICIWKHILQFSHHLS